MKKLMFLLVASLAIIACDETKKRTATEQKPNVTIVDTTVYGKCADAAHFTVLLATASGDTVEYIIPADSDEVDKVLVGGLYNDDRLAVIAYRNADGENIARRIINLTSLAGKWTDGDRNIDLNENADWKILNGNIVIAGDTFSVYDITPDTLTLENATGIFLFERQE